MGVEQYLFQSSALWSKFIVKVMASTKDCDYVLSTF